MEYIEITKEEAIAIIDGGRTCHMTIIDAAGYPQQMVATAPPNSPRRLFVADSSGSGTSIVYTGDNNDELLVGSGDEYEDVLVDSSEMKSCTWWIGEDEQHCILEARDKDGGCLWSGTILGKPTSKEYVHSLVGGPPPVQDKELKYEYKNVYLRSAQYSVDVNRMYKYGWEPVCSSMVYDKQLEQTSALFTLRRRIN